MRYEVSVKLKKDFIEVDGNKIVIGVKAVPEKGKANDEVIKKIAKHFGVPKAAVRIISGATSRKKIIDVAP
ncbi:MAG TPA: DUF167 family protein [Candidatus Paceibacterota bacterium]|nr:DUF167 family protein [Candidatus Paceibacterota bacterium]